MVLLSVSAVAGYEALQAHDTFMDIQTRGIRIFDKWDDGFERSSCFIGSGVDIRLAMLVVVSAGKVLSPSVDAC